MLIGYAAVKHEHEGHQIDFASWLREPREKLSTEAEEFWRNMPKGKWIRVELCLVDDITEDA